MIIWVIKNFFVQFCVFLPPLLNIFCFCQWFLKFVLNDLQMYRYKPFSTPKSFFLTDRLEAWLTLGYVRLFATPWTIQSMEFLGQNTRVGNLSLLQGIFPTQELNPGLPHGRQILYQLSHKGSQRILACVACPFSRGSSQPRNPTGVSCIAGGFFTNWAIREAQSKIQSSRFFPSWIPQECWNWICLFKDFIFNQNREINNSNKNKKDG